MEALERDIIIGIHSIAEALKNPARNITRIVTTEEGIKELQSRGGMNFAQIQNFEVKKVSPHQLQEMAKKIYAELGFNFNRVPSGIYLECERLSDYDSAWLYDKVASGEVQRILCLDKVTDVHNGAAILRTAAFYGVDAVIIASRGNFGSGPSFSRIASGACEYVNIVRCSSLPKLILKLMKMGVSCIGFSEHATVEAKEVEKRLPMALIMGAEDVGLSNAVERVIEKRVAFKPLGEIKSLNVSVAAAVAMEMMFS